MKDITQAGITSRQILLSLRENNPCLYVVAKTVNNAKAKICWEYLAGHSMIEALIDELGECGFKYNIYHDKNCHALSRVFHCLCDEIYLQNEQIKYAIIIYYWNILF